MSDSSSAAWSIGGILSGGYFWGFVSLVFAAIALSGKLDVTAGKILLVLAWLMAVWAIYKFSPIHGLLPIPRGLAVMALSGIIGLFLYYLALWMGNQEPPVIGLREDKSTVQVIGPNKMNDDFGVEVVRMHLAFENMGKIAACNVSPSYFVFGIKELSEAHPRGLGSVRSEEFAGCYQPTELIYYTITLLQSARFEEKNGTIQWNLQNPERVIRLQIDFTSAPDGPNCKPAVIWLHWWSNDPRIQRASRKLAETWEALISFPAK